MDVNDAEMVFCVVLVVSAVVIWKWSKRRRRAPQWHEQPRRSNKPDLAELEDVQRREFRRPL